MTTIGVIRGSGLPVPSKTSSIIDSQIHSQATLNATAEHAHQTEGNHPVVLLIPELCPGGQRQRLALYKSIRWV